MIILNIETSTTVCSASITVNGEVQALRLDQESNSHARLLPCFVQELLAELRQQGKMLDAVALSQGPGSYTGLRIGTATAKGICYGMQIPLIPIDTLQIIAAMAIEQPAALPADALLCPMIDARRMEVYNAFYTPDLQPAIADTQATIITGTTFADLLKERTIVFCGNGAEKCKAVLTDRNALFIDNIYPSAAYMGKLAEAYCQLGKAKEEADIAYFSPYYLKEFQATVSKNKVF